jgi:hypothetical protein
MHPRDVRPQSAGRNRLGVTSFLCVALSPSVSGVPMVNVLIRNHISVSWLGRDNVGNEAHPGAGIIPAADVALGTDGSHDQPGSGPPP